MQKSYGTTYVSLGTTYNVNMQRPTVRVITGRGSHSTVENKRGSMAVVAVTLGRLLLGRVQVPYDGVQEYGLFDLTAGGLKLLQLLNKEYYRGNVSSNSKFK